MEERAPLAIFTIAFINAIFIFMLKDLFDIKLLKYIYFWHLN